MGKKKKALIIAAIVVLLPIIGIAMLIFVPWLLFSSAILIQPPPPSPEITYGEFPISVTYQINDDVKVLNDIVVCEYEGIKISGSGSKYRSWAEKLKSGKKMLTLLDLKDEAYYTDWGTQVVEICLDPGSAEYYLGETNPRFGPPEPPDGEWIDYLYLTKDGKYGYSAFTKEEMWEKFKVKILNIDYTKPIKNSFK